MSLPNPATPSEEELRSTPTSVLVATVAAASAADLLIKTGQAVFEAEGLGDSPDLLRALAALKETQELCTPYVVELNRRIPAETAAPTPKAPSP